MSAGHDHDHAQQDPHIPLRHSAAHVMAEAVLHYFPEAKLAIGPVIEDGFYYDFQLPRALNPEDLPRIEERMKEIIGASSDFTRRLIGKAEARTMFREQPFKLEIIEGIPDEQVSLYTQHTFTDLCEGPHVSNTKEIKAVKLLRTSGAYWRGDESRPQLQRIYGTAFYSQKELDEYLHRIEEAERRDHRKLGRELDLFLFDPIAPASPFFLPKGALVYNLLVAYVRGLEEKHGYVEVITPQIFSTDLWKRSGHYAAYQENMFFIQAEDREYGVKPMNCPAHAVMYSHRAHSYRELPLRYADFGRLHRFERSGVTHGLTRVRTFAQDDAHIFARPDQADKEIKDFIGLLVETYKMFGFEGLKTHLSLRPEKRVGSDEMWDKAEAILDASLRSLGVDFTAASGEGAFYGPKVDFTVRDAIGRDWQLGTIQLDFNLPERFDLWYTSETGVQERPVVLHRALLGSLERFMGILLEHTGGALPGWLAPVQAVVVPIADRHVAYARTVEARLKAAGLRVEVDDSNERMNNKIRRAQTQKVMYMLVVGDKEEADNAVALRLRSGENLGAQPLETFLARATEETRMPG